MEKIDEDNQAFRVSTKKEIADINNRLDEIAILPTVINKMKSDFYWQSDSYCNKQNEIWFWTKI